MPRKWTEEQKQRQREVIQRVKPWEKSTGPRTETGKERSKMNATLHGFAGQHWRGRIRQLKRDLGAIKRSMRESGLYNM